MGSGYTFPCMALVIHLAICTHVSKSLRIPYQHVMRNVYVYGDDIVVPVEWVDLAFKALTFVGLEVNKNKSYWRGPFRESCGGDYLHGNDVTPVRLRLSNSEGDARASACGYKVAFGNRAAAVLQIERHARELVKAKLHSASNVLYGALENALGDLPYVSGDSEVLGRYVEDSTLLASLLPRHTDGTHTVISCWVVRPKKVKVIGACPYRYLKSKLVKPDTFWLDRDDSRTDCGIIDIPRKVKLKKTNLSSLSLI